ncbi:MAG: DUF1446 domain-containing protein [Rhodobacteraceae bacterium]|nr:DUF1446 domain-containing protein [Paracoccaceae bacterium]
MEKIVHIGCAAGFAGDRFDASGPILADMAGRAGPKYLLFETLAERTLAAAQRLREQDPEQGYSPYLERYLRPCLAEAKRLGVRIVSNLGAANPLAAGRRALELAAAQNIPNMTVCVVTGDDLTAYLSPEELQAFPTVEGGAVAGRKILAANAYLGARPIAAALAMGADMVLVGRGVDSALALGPLMYEFGWEAAAWDRLAAGTICGHLLECGSQVTGGYFADPGFKDVPDLAGVGYPIAEVSADGSMVICKPAGTGGLVSRATVAEQILYEMHDPARYLVPDCVADVSEIRLGEAGPDRVRVEGVRGEAAPETLKATLCVENGWLAEAELSYAGPNALARADLAGTVVRERLARLGWDGPLRVEILGAGAVHSGGGAPSFGLAPDGEYRLRVAAPAPDREGAERVADEVLSLYCAGPAGGGGYRRQVTQEVATVSALIPRDRIEPHIRLHRIGGDAR